MPSPLVPRRGRTEGRAAASLRLRREHQRFEHFHFLLEAAVDEPRRGGRAAAFG